MDLEVLKKGLEMTMSLQDLGGLPRFFGGEVFGSVPSEDVWGPWRRVQRSLRRYLGLMKL